MDTPDRPDAALPAWPAAPTPPAAMAARASWDEGTDASAPAPRALTLKVALRAVRRHWWRILALWALGSAILVPLAHYKIRPTYDAFATLRIEPSNRQLVAAPYDTSTNFAPYLETQVQLITSPDVLGTALQNPRVAALPRIQQAVDAEGELRKELRVMITPKTNLIVVSMSSESPNEAATIVNAVVDAYKAMAATWTDEETQLELRRLRDLKNQFDREVADHRSKLSELVRNSAKGRDLEKEKDVVPLETYRAEALRVKGVELDLKRAEDALHYLEQTAGRAGRERPMTDEELDKAVEAAFLVDPAAARVADQIRATQETLRAVERLIPKANRGREPAILKRQQELERLRAEWADLWDKKSPLLRAQVGRRSPVDGDVAARPIDEAKARVRDLAGYAKNLRDHLKALKIAPRAEGDDNALQVEFTKVDLAQSQAMLDAVSKNLFQLEYEAKRLARTNQINKAKPSLKPTTDNRLRVMAAAPIGLLAALLGLFVLVEVRAARVTDPEDLPARVHLGVIGVVPPLPTLRPGRGLRGARDERRRVEEFVQSLDHLRVTLCAGQAGLGPRRCVLITSATGGEGKTTLAAQLAGRCANAGLLTLLVDADLRRPSLGELLEVPEGPGFADVLAGRATAEEVMVVIGNAGGFHLLPAGSPGFDPSRLLQGDRLGGLVARLRETFDVVILDAPPVLAVPDALMLGRWVDGAVLAVRHDASRFPLVERANRRLTAIGIPVLGAVVNGVRPLEATYGAYSYASSAAGPGPEPDGEPPPT